MEKNVLETIVNESKTINEVLTKLGKNTSSAAYKQFHKLIDEYDIDTSHFLTKKEVMSKMLVDGKVLKYNNDQIFTENSLVARSLVKKRLISEELIRYECSFCGNDGNWMNKKISLILDHINGINNDNRLDNLRFVCPNCNATLETHCVGHKGLNKEIIDKRSIYKPNPNLKNRKVDRPDLDVLLHKVDLNGYSATGREYGVSDTTIRKWIIWGKRNLEFYNS